MSLAVTKRAVRFLTARELRRYAALGLHYELFSGPPADAQAALAELRARGKTKKPKHKRRGGLK